MKVWDANYERTFRGGGVADTVAGRVRKLIEEELSVEPERVVDGAKLRDDLGADSLDEIELVMAIEKEFDFDVHDEAAQQLETVGDVVRFVEQAAGAR